MRDPDRIPKMLSEIEELWKKNPDLRLCQLICNIKSGDLYYLEDDELMKRLKATYAPFALKLPSRI